MLRQTTQTGPTAIKDTVTHVLCQALYRKDKNMMQKTVVNIPVVSAKQTFLRLDGHDIRLIEEINYLSNLQRKKSATGARYCCPSEMYLAKKLGVRREAVSRHVSKLARMGVLEVVHRRMLRGRWQTNLYKVRRAFAWLAGKALAIVNYRKNRVRQDTHIAHNKYEKENKPIPQPTNFKPKYSLTELFMMVRRGEKLPEM